MLFINSDLLVISEVFSCSCHKDRVCKVSSELVWFLSFAEYLVLN